MEPKEKIKLRRPDSRTAAAEMTTQSEGKNPPQLDMQAGATAQKTADPVGAGYYAAGQTTREIGFALRHPIIAAEIGAVSSGSTNISTNAARFATNDLGLQENASREGTEVNAFRHTLWQSQIATNYGDQIAHEVGNAHEADPFAINGANRNTTTFATRALADQSCDLRNNEIGRSLGDSSDPRQMNALALRVLDYFHSTGLWVAERQGNGTWQITQRRLPDDRYQVARARLLQLNANGFDPTQQAARDERAREEMERLQMQMMMMP